jgi:hexosaminidase
MLDEARHFFGKKIVKKILDLMALLKFNIFHWHLTDDQGWRVEIKKYPLLVEIGSKREGTMVLEGKHFTDLSKKEAKYDNIPVEGYYTQEDLKEIIQYAKDRFITIVPEIDFPGHVTAALASYPELSCTGGPFEVSKIFGIHKDVFCIGNNDVYNFCQDVLDEIMKIFPTKYIHVGGDEVPTLRWKQCEKCQAKLKEEGLTDIKKLQQYFTSKLNSFIKSKNHTLIGWNEILNDNLDIDAICQYWSKRFDVVITHIRRSRKFIMSKKSALYLSYPIELLSLQKAYVYDPIPQDLEERYANNILGMEACLWTEFVKNQEMLESMIFPRILAVSEVGWTSKSNKNFELFQEKLNYFDGFLKFYKDNY